MNAMLAAAREANKQDEQLKQQQQQQQLQWNVRSLCEHNRWCTQNARGKTDREREKAEYERKENGRERLATAVCQGRQRLSLSVRAMWPICTVHCGGRVTCAISGRISLPLSICMCVCVCVCAALVRCAIKQSTQAIWNERQAACYTYTNGPV